MAALVCEDAGATRLCTATCVAGGTITQLLRASNQGMTRTAPKGDLLLAAALSAAAISATHFQTTKRASAQRRQLIRQSDGLSYMQKAATFQSVARRAGCGAELKDAVALAPVVHNLRDTQRGHSRPQQQVPVHGGASNSASSGSWHFNLALQSSLL